jgi:hypothetical protein
METLTKLAVMTIGPVVDVLESLSFIGVNTHIVKLDAVVSDDVHQRFMNYVKYPFCLNFRTLCCNLLLIHWE